MPQTAEDVGKKYTPEVRKNIAAFAAWMAEDPERRTERTCSRMLRVAQATLNKLLNGVYPSQVARHAEDMLRLMAREAQRELAPGRPPYVQTGMADQVHDILSGALIEGGFVCILGPTGIGKTVAARAFFDAEDAALWLTAGSTCTQQAMLQELCRVLDLEPKWSAYTMQRTITEKLEGSRQLLIVDEADDMQLTALKTLRMIRDESLIGIALIGTSDFVHNLRLKRSATVNQIIGRVGDTLKLGEITRDDLEAIVAPYGLDDSAMETLWAGCHGQARRAVSALVAAQRGAKHTGGSLISEKAIRRAYQQLMPVLNGLARVG